MAENSPNLSKETYPGTGSTEGPQTRWTQKDLHKDISMKMSKVKDKEKILNAAREEETVSYKGTPISWFLYRNFADQKGVAKYIQSPKRPPKKKITGQCLWWIQMQKFLTKYYWIEFNNIWNNYTPLPSGFFSRYARLVKSM